MLLVFGRLERGQTIQELASRAEEEGFGDVSADPVPLELEDGRVLVPPHHPGAYKWAGAGIRKVRRRGKEASD